MSRVRRQVTGLLVLVGVAVVGGCGSAPDDGAVHATTTATLTAAGAGDDATAAVPVRQPCAEFPAVRGSGPDIEGWWSSSPAWQDGSIQRDPADWPAVVRDHLRTVLVVTDTREVLSSWDRVVCGPVEGFTVPDGADWPAGSVVVLDADTGEVVDTLSAAHL